MEREWLLAGLGLGHRCFFVLLTAICFFVQNPAVQRLRCRFWDVVSFEVHGDVLVFYKLLLSSIFIEPSLSDRLRVVLSL